jgi:hypothetical protein
MVKVGSTTIYADQLGEDWFSGRPQDLFLEASGSIPDPAPILVL